LNTAQINEVLELLKGTKKIQIIEQMINKKKSNYTIQLLPRVYSRHKLADQ